MDVNNKEVKMNHLWMNFTSKKFVGKQLGWNENKRLKFIIRNVFIEMEEN